MQNLYPVLWVGLGGFVGSAARYAVSLGIRGLGLGGRWPWATLAINLLGAIAIGTLWARAAEASSPALIRTLGMAGFCGGFTTFSAFSLETVELLRGGATALALAYVAVSVVLCVGGVWAGTTLARG